MNDTDFMEAYQLAIEQQNEALAIATKAIKDLSDERDRLRADLDAAVKALEWYANAGPSELCQDCEYAEDGSFDIFRNGRRASETLARIKGEK